MSNGFEEEILHRSLKDSDRRKVRSDAYYFSKKQLTQAMLTLFVGVILGVGSGVVVTSKWVFQQTIRDVVVETVAHHNVDPTAHATALLSAANDRAEILRQLAEVKTKISGIEEMLRVIALQGQFNVEPKKRK